MIWWLLYLFFFTLNVINCDVEESPPMTSTQIDYTSDFIIDIDSDVDEKMVCKLDRRFLSIAMSIGQLNKTNTGYDVDSAKLKNLLTALSPCYVRIGGTKANFVYFQPRNGSNISVTPVTTPDPWQMSSVTPTKPTTTVRVTTTTPEPTEKISTTDEPPSFEVTPVPTTTKDTETTTTEAPSILGITPAPKRTTMKPLGEEELPSEDNDNDIIPKEDKDKSKSTDVDDKEENGDNDISDDKPDYDVTSTTTAPSTTQTNSLDDADHDQNDDFGISKKIPKKTKKKGKKKQKSNNKDEDFLLKTATTTIAPSTTQTNSLDALDDADAADENDDFETPEEIPKKTKKKGEKQQKSNNKEEDFLLKATTTTTTTEMPPMLPIPSGSFADKDKQYKNVPISKKYKKHKNKLHRKLKKKTHDDDKDDVKNGAMDGIFSLFSSRRNHTIRKENLSMLTEKYDTKRSDSEFVSSQENQRQLVKRQVDPGLMHEIKMKKKPKKKKKTKKKKKQKPVFATPEEQEKYAKQQKKEKLLGYLNFPMTADLFDDLYSLFKETKNHIIVDVSAFSRTDMNSWDPTNAIELMDYVKRKQYDITWQLGNEPNSYGHNFGKTRAMSGRDVGMDYRLFAKTLSTRRYGKAKIIGPDTTRPKPNGAVSSWVGDFLKEAKNSLNVLTWHQYYANGRTVKAEEFLEPDLLDEFDSQCSMMRHTARKNGFNKPIWLTETGSAWGGGAVNISNRYVAGFPFLDKLGIAAQNCMKVVARQTFLSGKYAMIDRKTYEPYPDFYLAALYKRLVGNKVLSVRLNAKGSKETKDKYFRVYAHCSRRRKSVTPGAVTVYILNLNHMNRTFSFKGMETINVKQFLLTADDLQSDHVKLNDQLLQMNGDELPKMRGKVLSQPLNIPGKSFGFYVIDTAIASVCT